MPFPKINDASRLRVNGRPATTLVKVEKPYKTDPAFDRRAAVEAAIAAQQAKKS